MAFRGAASTAAAAPDAPVNRSNHTGGRPAQPNLLHNLDDVSESDEEEPPPYSRYDPLTEPPSEPPPQNTPHPPRQGGSQRPYPGRAQNSYHSNLPPAPRPPFSPHSSQGSASSHAGQYSPPFQQYPPKFPQPPAPFRYPPGYYCSKCHNTGVKVYNGSPCGTCARLFGRQMADVFGSYPQLLNVGETCAVRIFRRSSSKCDGRTGGRSTIRRRTMWKL
jgi:hypothetical protein